MSFRETEQSSDHMNSNGQRQNPVALRQAPTPEQLFGHDELVAEADTVGAIPEHAMRARAATRITTTFLPRVSNGFSGIEGTVSERILPEEQETAAAGAAGGPAVEEMKHKGKKKNRKKFEGEKWRPTKEEELKRGGHEEEEEEEEEEE